jgi:predicted DNA-binding protein
MAERNPQDQDKYVVRFPDGMRDRLKALAAANGRSMNNQIIHMLEFALIEMDMAGNVYAKAKEGEKTTPDDMVAFLTNEIRRNNEVLKSIIGDIKEGDLPDFPSGSLAKHTNAFQNAPRDIDLGPDQPEPTHGGGSGSNKVAPTYHSPKRKLDL